MANTKNTKKANDVVVEEAVVKEPKTKKAPKANEEKKASIVTMDNDTMRQLFIDNGCKAGSKAKNESKVVYQQFGTKSRVLQQGKAYQLLLTNGHQEIKGTVVENDNDDTARFLQFVDTLSNDEKALIVGIDSITTTKLSASEMPRERTCKLASYNLLVKFIQFMATFDENKILVTE